MNTPQNNKNNTIVTAIKPYLDRKTAIATDMAAGNAEVVDLFVGLSDLTELDHNQTRIITFDKLQPWLKQKLASYYGSEFEQKFCYILRRLLRAIWYKLDNPLVASTINSLLAFELYRQSITADLKPEQASKLKQFAKQLNHQLVKLDWALANNHPAVAAATLTRINSWAGKLDGAMPVKIKLQTVLEQTQANAG